jgi:hypothetical protein
LIINGVTYNVSRQNLAAFSSVVRSSLSTDPDLSELCFDIAVPDSVVSSTVAFLHGSPLNPPATEVFDYFFMGASLGLDIVNRRLLLPVFKSTTTANVDERFRALKPFPGFFSPILMFLDQDCSTLVLHREDAKFEFLRRYDDPSLFRALRFEDLSTPVLRQLFADAGGLPGCRTFALLGRLLAQRRRLRESQEVLDGDLARLRGNILQLSGEDDEKMDRIRRQSSDYAASAEIEAKVREQVRRLAARLELVAVCVSLLEVPSDSVTEFGVNLTALNGISDDIGRIIGNLQSAGASEAMPPGARKVMTIKEQWIEAVIEMQELARSFRVNSSAIDQCALSIAGIASALANA